MTEEKKLLDEIKKDPFTDEQRAAIDARGKVIVSASAGSGKTTVMIERIIQLVLGGVGVDEILAVTFTKKAAAQMKEKLSKKLIEKINAEDTDAEPAPEIEVTVEEPSEEADSAESAEAPADAE